jgi:hypothetical protein
MAAILRSGKFLRIVSGFARSGPAPAGGQQPPKEGSFPAFPLLDNSGGQLSFHAWSVQHLQNALPLLSTDPEKNFDDKNNAGGTVVATRRGSDPLLDFYVDTQKIEEDVTCRAGGLQVASSKKSSTPASSSEAKNLVGLNVVKDVERDLKHDQQAKPAVKHEAIQFIVPDEPVQEAVVVVETEKVVDEPVQAEVVASIDVTYQEKEIQQPELPLVSMLEDPTSHEWYPLPVVCQMFRAQGRLYDLEGLLWGSQGIRPEDRKCIYYWTLQAYADCGMFPQAVDLTRRLESEGLGLEFPEYHTLMNSFAMAVYQHQQVIQSTSSLNSGDLQTPMSSSVASMALHTEQSLPPTPASEAEEQMALQALYHRKLKKALASKESKASLDNYRGLERTGRELNVTESSNLIELLVRDDLIEEATDVTEKMLAREAYPMPKIFRFLLNKLASRGEVEAMTRLGTYLTPRIKKEVSFDNRLCNAYLAAGRGADYLQMLCYELDEAVAEAGGCYNLDPAKLQSLKDKFPRGGAMGLLESNPGLVDSYTILALKFVNLGYVAPVNVLWTYHFINGRHHLAEPLWNAYVKTCPQIMFQKVCQTARSTSNVDLAQRLVGLLEDAVVTNGARGIAYSCLLDVLTQTKDYLSGVTALQTGLKSGIQLEDMNRTALKRLKEGVEAEGSEFPYDIPRKTAMNDSDTNTPLRSLTPSLMMD